MLPTMMTAAKVRLCGFASVGVVVVLAMAGCAASGGGVAAGSPTPPPSVQQSPTPTPTLAALTCENLVSAQAQASFAKKGWVLNTPVTDPAQSNLASFFVYGGVFCS